MQPAARSVQVFGVYLALVGLTLLLVPNTFLDVVNVSNTKEVWIRLSGMLLMALSVYYLVAARHQLHIIFKVTACIRCTIILFFTVFWLLDLMEPVMLIFAGIDFLGGVWTYTAMRKEGTW